MILDRVQVFLGMTLRAEFPYVMIEQMGVLALMRIVAE